MAKALTAKSVEAASAGTARREIPDAAFPGLYLIVQPSGARSWAYRYRHIDKPRKLTLGRYPGVSLARARDAAREAAQAVDLGKDPGAVKTAARADARIAEATRRDRIATLVAEYDRRHLSGLRSGAAARAFLDRSAVASWGDRDVRTITKRDVVEMLDGIVDRGSPIAANRTLAHVRAFFGWCVSRDVIASSPAAGVRPPAAERSRDRVLTDAEVAVFWRATDKIGEPFGPLYRLLLLTGQRLREVAEMRESEFEGDVWTIPAARAKNAEAHVVHLSAPALAALGSVRRINGPGRFVFTTSGAAPVSGFARAKLRLDKALTELADGPIPPFVIHDLRRATASGMAELGIAPHVIEAALNHRSGTVSGVARVYNRHPYEAEKRAALEAWSRRVLELAGELPPAENVGHLGAVR